MSFKLSALLNPAPDSDSEPTHRPQHVDSSTPNLPAIAGSSSNTHGVLSQAPHPALDQSVTLTTTQEAPAQSESRGSSPVSVDPANALNASNAQSQAQDQPMISEISASASRAPRPPDLPLAATPVEPSRPLERDPPSLSPTLDQYHRASHSPTQVHTSTQSSSLPVELAPMQVQYSSSIPDSLLPKQEQEKMTIDESEEPSVAIELYPEEERSAAPSTTEPVVENGTSGEMEDKIQVQDASPAPPDDTQEKASSAGLENPPSPLHIPSLIKDSGSNKSRSTTPFGASTPKGVTQIKEEETLMPAPSSARSTPSRATPTSTKPRKGTISKKGTVTKKAPTKSRGLGVDSPESSRSATPASSRLSKTTNARQSSTPIKAASSPAADYDEEAELYCICRKPDNHTWMIACDGCDDWFHGSCVDMKEENAQLVDKYFCKSNQSLSITPKSNNHLGPRCADPSIGKRTTWLRVCRLSSCNQPAILTKGKESKYCCEEHGQAFFKEKLLDSPQATSKSKKRKRGSKSNHNDDGSDASFHASSPSEADTLEPALGGRLGPRQLAKIIKSTEGDLKRFKHLGEPIVSSSMSINTPDAHMTDNTLPSSGHDRSTLTSADKTSLDAIHKRLSALSTRRSLLIDRETFLSKAKDAAKRIAREEGVKELCGYDDRLGMGEEEFEAWRASDEGTAFYDGSGPTTNNSNNNNNNTNHMDTDMDTEDGTDKLPAQLQICKRRRCAHHSTWKTISLDEIRVESKRFADEDRKARLEIREIRERAALRGPVGGEGDDDDGRGISDGWVEVVGPVRDGEGDGERTSDAVDEAEGQEEEGEKMDEDP
jgi:COMPASS component SPP1